MSASSNTEPYNKIPFWNPVSTGRTLPSGPVYHYTSSVGFHGIISTAELWFTHVAYLNDPGELHYPIKVANEVLRELMTGKDRPYLERAWAAFPNSRFHDGLYVGSFSMAGNLLSQWRAYCPDGGYSLCFDPAGLVENPVILTCGDVCYDEAEQKRRISLRVQAHLQGK